MTAPAPLYEKVKRHITDAIVAGEYSPGDKLPSESALVGALSVSRMTVNRALRELTRDGVIFRMQGVGSFVSQGGHNASLAEVRDIRDIIGERGASHSCAVLKLARASASADVAGLMEMEPGAALMRAELLHLENGTPLQLETKYVRADFAPALLDQDFTKVSLFEYLCAVAPLTELEHVVEAARPDKSEQNHLALRAEEPVLRIRRRTWVGRKIVTLGYLSHPGTRYRVAVRVRPAGQAR